MLLNSDNRQRKLSSQNDGSGAVLVANDEIRNNVPVQYTRDDELLAAQNRTNELLAGILEVLEQKLR